MHNINFNACQVHAIDIEISMPSGNAQPISYVCSVDVEISMPGKQLLLHVMQYMLTFQCPVCIIIIIMQYRLKFQCPVCTIHVEISMPGIQVVQGIHAIAMDVEISMPDRHNNQQISTDAQYTAIPNSSSGYVCAVNVCTTSLFQWAQIVTIAITYKQAVIAASLYTKHTVLFL